MPPDCVTPVIDLRSWPFQLIGYKLKISNIEMMFWPYEVIQMQLPNPGDFFAGMSPVQAGACRYSLFSGCAPPDMPEHTERLKHQTKN